MPQQGNYFYPGSAQPPPQGSGQAYVGRGPVDVNILGSSSPASAQSITITSISGTVVQQSSSFTGQNWVVILNSTEVLNYPNFAITVVNNHATNKLESGSVEFSPNNTNWETDWDLTTFAGLSASSGINSVQVLGNSRRYVRVRAIPSGSDGAFTGSTDVYLTMNYG